MLAYKHKVLNLKAINIQGLLYFLLIKYALIMINELYHNINNIEQYLKE